MDDAHWHGLIRGHPPINLKVTPTCSEVAVKVLEGATIAGR